jgi:hypothetical protein
MIAKTNKHDDNDDDNNNNNNKVMTAFIGHSLMPTDL